MHRNASDRTYIFQRKCNGYRQRHQQELGEKHLRGDKVMNMSVWATIRPMSEMSELIEARTYQRGLDKMA